ncbi:MAG: hypothetical protein ACI4TI_02800, partial [Christensenellales bacterium]
MTEKCFDKEFIKTQFRNFAERVLKPKSIDSGCFGGIHQKYWVECCGKEYMFKFNDGKDDYSDFGEVFVSYLSYVLGYKCINSIFCKDFFSKNESIFEKVGCLDKLYGVLIESYRTKNVTEMISLKTLVKIYNKRQPADGMSTWEVVEICKDYCKDKNIIFSKQIEQELKEMALLDYLFVQADRGPNNIEFLIEEKHGKKYLKLAPMFDNGFCLHLMNSFGQKGLVEKLQNKYLPLDNNSTNPKPDLYIQCTQNKALKERNNENNIVVDLAKELLRNKPLMKLYEDFKSLNIKDEVEFVCEMYKRELPQIKKDIIYASIENRIS